jgi:Autotransporter beta-domain.
MRSAVRAAALALALPFLLPSVLTAQHRRPGIVDVSGRTRHGFWGSLGLGAGAEAVDLVNPDDGLGYSDNLTKPTVQLRLGGTVNPHLRLGGELSSWINSYYGTSGNVTETVGGVFGIAQFYPARRAGFYLKGGMGLGRSAVDYSGGPTISDYGWAAVLGAGYDIRVGRHLAITPTVDFQHHDYSGAQGGGYRERIWSVGVGLTYQSGGM